MRISRWALAALVPIVALTFLMVSAPQSAEAAGPTTLGRTPWQMLRWPTLIPTPGFGGPHGATSLYGLAPAVPPVSDPAWGPAPNGSTVGFSVASRIPGCFNYADFTYFQTLVDVPTGTTLTTFTIAFSGMDDGSRVSIFNSANPGGLVIPGSYVFLGGTGTTNLAPYVVAGETNRVVITQVDDCAVGNNLISATVVLNGNTVVVTPTADLSITKVALQPTVAVGSLITYQLNLQNFGPAGAPAIVIEDNLPPSVKFLSATSGCVHDGAITGGKVTCSGIAVNPSIPVPPIQITVMAMTAGTALNNAAITNIGANLIDPNPANNQASVTTTITPPPVPPAPPFGLPGPVVAGARVCVPLYMDQNLETQYWWARAAGGALD